MTNKAISACSPSSYRFRIGGLLLLTACVLSRQLLKSNFNSLIGFLRVGVLTPNFGSIGIFVWIWKGVSTHAAVASPSYAFCFDRQQR